jgi:hypothetical protein
MKTAQNRLGDHSMAVGNSMTGHNWRDVRSIGNGRAEARVRTSAIVVRHSLGEDGSHLPLTQGNHKVQTLAANRANRPFARRVRLGRPDGRFDDGQAHRLQRAINTLGVDAVVVVVHDKSV